MARVTTDQALAAGLIAAGVDQQMGLTISAHPRTLADAEKIAAMIDTYLGEGQTTRLEDEDSMTWRSWGAGGRIVVHFPRRDPIVDPPQQGADNVEGVA